MNGKKEQKIESYFNKIAKNKDGFSIKLLPYLQAGLPDRLLLLKTGKFYFVELKREKGGVVSPIQKLIFSKLERLGFKVYILSSYEQIDDFFKNL